MATYTIDDCAKWAEQYGGKCLSTSYTGCEQKIEWECSKGHRFKTIFNSIRNGSWCGVCYVDSLRITPEKVEKLLNEKGFDLLSPYTNSKIEITVRCKKDNYVWKTNWNCINAGHKCPKCSNRPKITVQDIEELVKSKNGEVIDVSFFFPRQKHNNRQVFKRRTHLGYYLGLFKTR